MRNDEVFVEAKNEDVMKTHCKSCVLHPIPGKRAVGLKRQYEILAASVEGCSQICHNGPEDRNFHCYGIREYQIHIFYRMGLIPEETEASLLETMYKTLKGKE